MPTNKEAIQFWIAIISNIGLIVLCLAFCLTDLIANERVGPVGHSLVTALIGTASLFTAWAFRDGNGNGKPKAEGKKDGP